MIDILVLFFLPVLTFYLLRKRLENRFYLSLVPLGIAILFSIISPVATRLIPIQALAFTGGIFLFGNIAMAVVVPFSFLADTFQARHKELVIFAGTILTYLAIVVPGFGCALGHCDPAVLSSFVDTLHLAGDAEKTGQFFVQLVTALVMATGAYGLLLLCETLLSDIRKRKLPSILFAAVIVVLFLIVGASILIGFFVIALFSIIRTIPTKIVRILAILMFLIPLVLVNAYIFSLLPAKILVDGSLFSVLVLGFTIVLPVFICSLGKEERRPEKAVLIVSVLTASVDSALVSWWYTPGISLQQAIGAAFGIGYPAPGSPFPEGLGYLAVVLVVTFIIGNIAVLGYQKIIREMS